VNRSLKDVIDNSVSLRYKVNLGARGMVDGIPSIRARTSIAYRMGQLEASQDSWDQLRWTSRQNLTYLWPPQLLLDGTLLAVHNYGEDVRLLRIPSKFRNVEADERMLHGLERRDFCIDDASKLLVTARGESLGE